MSSQEDNVLDLLDSLGTRGAKAKPKKSMTKRKEQRREGDDARRGNLSGLLDLDEGSAPASAASSAAPSRPASAAPPAEDPAAGAVGGLPAAAGLEALDSGPRAPSNTPAENTPAESAVPTPANEAAGLLESDPAAGSEGGGDPVKSLASWWSRNKGGLWSRAQETLTDAVSDAVRQAKQAEALVREEQQNFNFSALQSRLTSVLNTIVPPISQHEQLRIHIFHDMVGWPVVDEIVFDVFDYVMDQIEGASKLNLIVQKGHERHLAGSDKVAQRKLNVAECTLADGVKLARASIEEISRAQAEASAGATADAAATGADAGADAGDGELFKQSELYVSLQPVVTKASTESTTISHTSDSLYFVAYLADFHNAIELSSASQPLPAEWADWLDDDSSFDAGKKPIDPRKWITGWVEDSISLVLGVVVQKYVTRRMGLA